MSYTHISRTLVTCRTWPEPMMTRSLTPHDVTRPRWVNTLRPLQNGRHFPDDIFKCVFLNENVWTSIKISLKFIPKGSIDNIPALVQIMAWRRPGDKPSSEPMMVRLPTHICVTRPQWVNRTRWVSWRWLIIYHFHWYTCPPSDENEVVRNASRPASQLHHSRPTIPTARLRVGQSHVLITELYIKMYLYNEHATPSHYSV